MTNDNITADLTGEHGFAPYENAPAEPEVDQAALDAAASAAQIEQDRLDTLAAQAAADEAVAAQERADSEQAERDALADAAAKTEADSKLATGGVVLADVTEGGESVLTPAEQTAKTEALADAGLDPKPEPQPTDADGNLIPTPAEPTAEQIAAGPAAAPETDSTTDAAETEAKIEADPGTAHDAPSGDGA